MREYHWVVALLQQLSKPAQQSLSDCQLIVYISSYSNRNAFYHCVTTISFIKTKMQKTRVVLVETSLNYPSNSCVVFCHAIKPMTHSAYKKMHARLSQGYQVANCNELVSQAPKGLMVQSYSDACSHRIWSGIKYCLAKYNYHTFDYLWHCTQK